MKRTSETRNPKEHGKSTTQDILGMSRGRQPVPRKWASHYRRLTELREEFMEGRSHQTEDAKDELFLFSEHVADAATDSFDRDCALALLSSTQNALYEIDQALRRILDGTYGVCELTGQPIEPARLEVIPWTRFSAPAQAQIEARGGGPGVRLGKRAELSKAEDARESEDDGAEEPVEREALSVA